MRFASALVSWLAGLLYEQSKGWRDSSKKLNTWEYVELDSVVPEDQREELLCRLDFSTPAAMDQSLCYSLGHIVGLSMMKAQSTGDVIPRQMIDRLVSFVERELCVKPTASAPDFR